MIEPDQEEDDRPDQPAGGPHPGQPVRDQVGHRARRSSAEAYDARRERRVGFLSRYLRRRCTSWVVRTPLSTVDQWVHHGVRRATMPGCDIRPRSWHARRACDEVARDDWDVLVVGGGPVGAAAGVLARRRRPPRPRRREEALPAREDVRRRAHAAGRPPAPRHGPRRPARRVPALRRPALDRPRRHPRARVARAPRLPVYGYVVRRRDLDEMVAERGGRRPAPPSGRGRGGRAARRGRPGRAARSSRQATGGPEPVRARYVVVADGANSRFGRALGTARDRSLPAGHGDPRLLHQPVPRRAVDREPPRPPRPRRQPPARLRLDLPGGRRHGERRRRPAVDVPGLEERQHQPT